MYVKNGLMIFGARAVKPARRRNKSIIVFTLLRKDAMHGNKSLEEYGLGDLTVADLRPNKRTDRPGKYELIAVTTEENDAYRMFRRTYEEMFRVASEAHSSRGEIDSPMYEGRSVDGFDIAEVGKDPVPGKGTQEM